ncbi:hypothetical protein Ssi02_38440 [Sinosporangium siamense]|uniref:Ribosomal protein mS38 C-terminal domain-containing protein n=1 Tax=Sinosporangium siamense TaxID=1367973 RepID=A0A919RGV8_9ACTN|nr:hypothetical protein Ssi02_38440 [Sinosporangium siamense]
MTDARGCPPGTDLPWIAGSLLCRCVFAHRFRHLPLPGGPVGSVIKKRRKRMAKKKHRKLLKKTRIQRRNKK